MRATDETYGAQPASGEDPQRDEIVDDEERVLSRVLRTIAARDHRPTGMHDYDQQLISLRDQIAEARLEDVPPLIEEMERLQQVAARRAEVQEGRIDPASPYFGRLVLEEDDRKREVLIGRGTFLDPRTGVKIVDWRDAPISRLYYRYDEGDDYEETFGGRLVEGEILTRHTLSISAAVLRRIGCPQGTFVRDASGRWRRASPSASRLAGGEGAAMRAEAHHSPRRLGTGRSDAREDKHLPEIAALIDPRQFDLITGPSSGLVVIQGGAGSGKTTIGLHRMAYLAFQDARRFRADRMLVVVFNDALARYISRVLPALGVGGVAVTTFEAWAHKQRVLHLRRLPRGYTEATPSGVVRVKKHPAMLRIIDDYVARLTSRVGERLAAEVKGLASGDAAIRAWQRAQSLPIGQRVEALAAAAANQDIPLPVRHAIERVATAMRSEAMDVPAAWADLLTNRTMLEEGFAAYGEDVPTAREIAQTVSWCTERTTALLAAIEDRSNGSSPPGDGKDAEGGGDGREGPHMDDAAAVLDAEPPRSGRRRSTRSDADDGEDGAGDSRDVGIDGRPTDDEPEGPALDREDDALLLRLVQRMRGPLRAKRDKLTYEHVFVDEAQDLSPVELAVVLDATSQDKSVTLAGDTAQRLLMDNGFTDWRHVLRDLGLEHVAIEPLRVSYRSTHPIIELAREVLGPLADEETGTAIRDGAPVELFQFGHAGEAVAFLGEALRELAQAEPRASIAVIARYPEQADLYYRGLANAEVPNLRRIAEQDFPFRPGIDVTDVRQVKGLEFDYVVLVEVSDASYGSDDEARHLLHIAATRAAHQLWTTTTTVPSPLLPESLRERAQ